MWNQIAELGFIKKLGWGAGVILIGALFTQFKKLKPVTTLSSTKVEKLLYTKEMRTSASIMLFIFHVFIASLVLYGLTGILYAFYKSTFISIAKNQLDTVTLIILGIYILSSFILFISANFQKGIIEWIFKSREGRINGTFVILTIFTLSSFFFFPNIIVSSVISGSITYENNSELIGIILAAVIILIPVSAFNVFALKRLWATLLQKLRSYSGEYFYILFEGDPQRWFVYHQIENELFLIGDSEISDDSKIFKTIEKKDLITKKIYVYRVMNEPERTIEYSI